MSTVIELLTALTALLKEVVGLVNALAVLAGAVVALRKATGRKTHRRPRVAPRRRRQR